MGNKKTIEEALAKVYIVKWRRTSGAIATPICLIGKRIKLSIIGEGKCEECGGLGNVDKAAGFALDCSVCGGTGWVKD